MRAPTALILSRKGCQICLILFVFLYISYRIFSINKVLENSLSQVSKQGAISLFQTLRMISFAMTIPCWIDKIFQRLKVSSCYDQPRIAVSVHAYKHLRNNEKPLPKNCRVWYKTRTYEPTFHQNDRDG